MATSFNNIGLIYFKKSEYEKALESYQKALLILEEIGEYTNRLMFTYKNMALCFKNIAVKLKNKQELNKAIEYFEKAHQLSETIGLPQAITYQQHINLYKTILGYPNFLRKLFFLSRAKGKRKLTNKFKGVKREEILEVHKNFHSV